MRVARALLQCGDADRRDHAVTTSVDATVSLDRAVDLGQRLEAELGRTIVGQRQVIREILIAFLAGGHCLLRGVPGLAKTLIIKTLARSIDLSFNRIQFTPDLMPSDIVGAEVMEEDRTTGRREMRFLRGPVFAHILLADEINRTPPRTQAALLEAMQERQVTVGGNRHELPAPQFVLATQNPIEQEGTYSLPEAQLDRFLLNVVIDYPSAAEEREMLNQTTSTRVVEPMVVASGAEIAAVHQLVRDVPAASNIVDYATRLVRATRPSDPTATQDARTYVRWGAGPRAGQALLLCGKARALLDGRATVAVDDIQALALPVLRHRVLVNFPAEAERIDADAIVERLVRAVPVGA
jgi:MoxR-like ATPase